MTAAFNKLLLRAESAKHNINRVAASAVCDEHVFGALAAEYFESRRELMDCLDVLTGGKAERIIEVFS